MIYKNNYIYILKDKNNIKNNRNSIVTNKINFN